MSVGYVSKSVVVASQSFEVQSAWVYLWFAVVIVAIGLDSDFD